MSEPKEYCSVVRALLDGVRDLIDTNPSDDELREAIHRSRNALVGEIGGRGLMAVWDYALGLFKDADAKVAISFKGMSLVVNVTECPIVAVDGKAAPYCRASHILLDEVCGWAGYCASIEREDNGHCVQSYWREGSPTPPV